MGLLSSLHLLGIRMRAIRILLFTFTFYDYDRRTHAHVHAAAGSRSKGKKAKSKSKISRKGKNAAAWRSNVLTHPTPPSLQLQPRPSRPPSQPAPRACNDDALLSIKPGALYDYPDGSPSRLPWLTALSRSIRRMSWPREGKALQLPPEGCRGRAVASCTRAGNRDTRRVPGVAQRLTHCAAEGRGGRPWEREPRRAETPGGIPLVLVFLLEVLIAQQRFRSRRLSRHRPARRPAAVGAPAAPPPPAPLLKARQPLGVPLLLMGRLNLILSHRAQGLLSRPVHPPVAAPAADGGHLPGRDPHGGRHARAWSRRQLLFPRRSARAPISRLELPRRDFPTVLPHLVFRWGAKPTTLGVLPGRSQIKMEQRRRASRGRGARWRRSQCGARLLLLLHCLRDPLTIVQLPLPIDHLPLTVDRLPLLTDRLPLLTDRLSPPKSQVLFLDNNNHLVRIEPRSPRSVGRHHRRSPRTARQRG
eukprot:scaffold1513_cov177-Isochrysis_galbana.AAC.1